MRCGEKLVIFNVLSCFKWIYVAVGSEQYGVVVFTLKENFSSHLENKVISNHHLSVCRCGFVLA
jgi:hypothetical protein